MAEIKKEEKIELTREYVVPLRKEFAKVPRYKKANKAIKALKEFMAKHMKVEDRDIRKVKIDGYLNEQIWHRGIKKPLHKVKVKAVKKNGIVYVELLDMPEVLKFKKQRIEKRSAQVSSSKKIEGESEIPKESKKSEIKEEPSTKVGETEESKEEKKEDSQKESKNKVVKEKTVSKKKNTSQKKTVAKKKTTI